MKRHSRFFVGEKIGEKENFILTDGAQIHQILRVLRLKEGSDAVLLDDSGCEYPALVEKIGEKEIALKILGREKNKAEPEIELSLFQSLLKKDKMEWIFEKGTELGVSMFVPVLSEHCVKTGLNFERAKKIIREAAEQSGRGKLAAISEISDFRAAVGNLVREKKSLNLILDADAESPLKKLVLGGKLPKKVNLFVGPEGGFSAEELAAAKQVGFRAVSLGGRILRAETAALAACALILS